MDRTILHSDINNFYASVECLYNPSIRNKPVAVGNNSDATYGVVLAKNYLAKKFQIKTGESLWEAKRKCPELVIVPANFDRYLRFSKMAIEIYNEYTNQIEPFGLDECWLDVTNSPFGDGETIANTIRDRIKKELGVTVSIGVSFNKIFAKLGSDLKKPDATTVIHKDNFKSEIWELNVKELLCVGKSTQNTLKKYNIFSIGDLASASPQFIKRVLGKRGEEIWSFANGYDSSPVAELDSKSLIKSIGNSTTTKKNLETYEDVKIILYKLVESVTERLRRHEFVCSTIQITVRDNTLTSYERQATLDIPCSCTNEIFNKAFELFKRHHNPFIPVRKLGVRACNLSSSNITQLSFDDQFIDVQKNEDLDKTMDTIRYRFGHFAVQRGVSLVDTELSSLNPKDDHKIHPIAWTK
jgi:DNA polymerase-4